LQRSYKDQLATLIRESDVFIAVISRLSVASPEVREEIDQANIQKKKLLPVLAQDGFDKAALHEALRLPQWTYLRPIDDFGDGIRSLVEAANTNFDLMVVHTWLTQHATDWAAKARPDSALLSGSDLKEAENWLPKVSANQQELPNVTPLQADFVLASQRARSRRAQRITGVTLVIIVVLTVLTVYAFQQRRIARKNERTAVANAKREQVARRVADENAAEAKRQEGIARENADKERIARESAETQARIAESRRLAAESSSALTKYPQRSLLP
jgi:TIR domain